MLMNYVPPPPPPAATPYPSQVKPLCSQIEFLAKHWILHPVGFP